MLVVAIFQFEASSFLTRTLQNAGYLLVAASPGFIGALYYFEYGNARAFHSLPIARSTLGTAQWIYICLIGPTLLSFMVVIAGLLANNGTISVLSLAVTVWTLSAVAAAVQTKVLRGWAWLLIIGGVVALLIQLPFKTNDVGVVHIAVSIAALATLPFSFRRARLLVREIVGDDSSDAIESKESIEQLSTISEGAFAGTAMALLALAAGCLLVYIDSSPAERKWSVESMGEFFVPAIVLGAMSGPSQLSKMCKTGKFRALRILPRTSYWLLLAPLVEQLTCWGILAFVCAALWWYIGGSLAAYTMWLAGVLGFTFLIMAGELIQHSATTIIRRAACYVPALVIAITIGVIDSFGHRSGAIFVGLLAIAAGVGLIYYALTRTTGVYRKQATR